MVEIDVCSGDCLSLEEACKLLPPNHRGKPHAPSTVWRWINDGIEGPSGRVYLSGVRLGGRWLTSKAALHAFVREQTPTASSNPPPLAGRSEADVSAELDAAGV